MAGRYGSRCTSVRVTNTLHCTVAGSCVVGRGELLQDPAARYVTDRSQQLCLRAHVIQFRDWECRGADELLVGSSVSNIANTINLKMKGTGFDCQSRY